MTNKENFTIETYNTIREACVKKQIFDKASIMERCDYRFTYTQVSKVLKYMIEKGYVKEWTLHKGIVYEWIGDTVKNEE